MSISTKYTWLTNTGNHDITLDEVFYSNHGAHFHNQYPQDPAECIRLLQDDPSITYLRHEAKVIRLTREGGPHTTFKVFGSPYSPARGLWAFSYLPHEAFSLWETIPLDTDVVLTHTPPKYHCDESRDRGAVGCEDLRQTLWRVRPRLAICGHVHEGRGVHRVRWDLTSPDCKYKECGISYWTDPGMNNKKKSYINLTRKGGEPLKNHDHEEEHWKDDSQLTDKRERSKEASSPGPPFRPFSDTVDVSTERASTSNHVPYRTSAFRLNGISSEVPTDMRDDVASNEILDKSATSAATHGAQGQEGLPPSARFNMEAFEGRMGRQETCVINAAIMASSWPHKSSGDTKYNKPIVVDLQLPAWNNEATDV